MIRAILYRPQSRTFTEGGAELIDVWDGETDSSIWVELSGGKPEVESKLMSERFGIHSLAIKDALRDRHPPKIEPFTNNTFILLKGLDAETDSISFGTIQLSIFVGDRFLLTRASKHSVSADRVREELLSGTLRYEFSTAALGLRLCRTVSDRFVPVLLSVESRLEEMETEMLERPNDELLAELVRQKSDLKKILRVVQYHAQVFTSASSQIPAHLAGYNHELTDLQEQLDRQLSLARLYYELTDDLMTGYLSLSSHRLNQIMQTLTIVTMIFVPITFMAGIYGMNFEFMPELSIRNAYFFLLGSMLLVVAGILALLHHRGWIGKGGAKR
ncbi:MAG: magnesium transporter CorA family protein [Candidatus Eisenbacteria bacterium]|uniref:Magnesium transporter CorA family protein n=1 Tax=Eiseniibacteriota bacterium TaxID=2212470 RepID=A0A7Y2ECW9_UNCEI|nr:magnesium transporter CorA family protein [Candidatus Eisenbacteria bacterium]